MLKITLILFISAFCFAADQLPASTINAVKAYDAEVAKAKAEYDKREDAAKKILVSALRKVQDAETKAGNLEGALAIKKRIDELSSNDMLGDKFEMTIDKMLGKWTLDNKGFFEILPNGKGNSTWGIATWKVENGVFVLTQGNSVHHITMIDNNTCEVFRINDSKKSNMVRNQ